MSAHFFDDFQLGAQAESATRTLTEADVMAFANLTGDWVKLHTDEAYAKTTAFGQRIAHGALVFSVSMGLATQLGLFDETLIAFAGVDKLRFVAPVFFGDTVRVVKTVVEMKPMGTGKGIVTFDSRVLNQDGKLVVAYMDRLLIKRRPSDTGLI